MKKLDYKFRTRAVMTLLLTMLCSIGAWAQQALPYSYGFENGDVTTDGWIANISSSHSGIQSAGAPHSGSYGFSFLYSEQNASLISPVLTGGDNGVDVTFWYKEYSNTYGDEQFQVGYTTNENVTDAGEFTYGDVVTASTDWQQYSNTFPAGTKRIAVKYIYNDCYYLFLDDFSFEASTSCTKPADLTVSNISTDEATISWTSDADLFNLRYKANGAENWTTVEGIDKGTEYPLDNLTPGTSYDVEVQAVCSSTEQSKWASISFTTDCPESFGIPYAYGFEDAAAISCWTLSEPDNSFVDKEDTSFARTGNNFFFFNYTQNPPQYLISPLLSGIDNGLHVEFYYSQYTNGVETFQVGYSTTDNNPDSFTWGDEITASTSYQRFSANYPAETKYVAVKHTSNDQYYLFLDDFLFEESASVLEPTSVHAADETTTSATISWTAGASETAWDLYVTEDANDVPDETTTPTVANISDNPYSLTNLTPATYYYVYVRANVGSETSAWSSPVRFNTKAEPMALPYSYAFEDEELPIGWNVINENTSYNNVSIMTPSSSSSNRVLAYYIGSNTGSLAAVLPEVDAAYPLNGYQISFDACYANNSTSSMTSGKLGIGIMTDPEDLSTFELIEEVDITDGFSTFGSHTVMFNNYTGSGHYIAIKNSYTASGYILVDNISVTALPGCIPPTDLEVADIAATTATLSWTSPEDQDTWQICLNGDEENLILANSNPFTLTDLTTATAYTVKVRTYCSETEQSDWSNEVNFTTTVEPITNFPWTEDFNELTENNSIPVGWDNSDGTIASSSPAYKWCYNTNTTGNGATNGTSHDGSNCVRFNSYLPQSGLYNILKTIPLALPSDQDLQLTFWYKNPTGGDFSVYISTDGGSTYETALATGLTGVSNWTKIDPIYLNEYAGQQVMIVFKGTSNYGNGDAYIYLDDVTVEEIPSCAAPSALTADNITSNSADLSWTANSGESEWTLYYKKISDTDYTEVTNVTENPYTLTGLSAATTYEFYVTAICSETDQSVASNVYSFTTECDLIIVDAENPFFEGFEGTTFVPSCWTSIANADSRKWTRNTTSSYCHTGSGSARSGYYGDIYLIMPDIMIAEDAVLSFWQKNNYINDYVKNSVILIDGNEEIELWSPSEATSVWENVIIDLSAYIGQTVSLAFKYEGYNAHDWYIDDVEVYVPATIELANDATDNSIVIDGNYRKTADVKLTGRTLFKDGSWNTLCLPFDVTLEGSILEGATAKTLSDATINGTSVTLTFGNAESTLTAGTPYIIKWDAAEDIVDPVFTNVTISATEGSALEFAGGSVKFVGYYNPMDITPEDEGIYYLKADNTLAHTAKARTLKAFRAYFEFTEEAQGARTFVLDFSEGSQATSISSLPADMLGEGDWYTVSGVKVGTLKKGVYINNGKKVVIK